MKENGDRVQVARVEGLLEETWALLDEVLDGLTAEDWGRKHGPDWTFADVPWHMSYIDRLVVADSIEAGPDMPEEKQLALASAVELNRWNAAQLAERPADMPSEELLARMRQVRQRCRELLAGMTDADLDQPAWFPIVLFRGWRTRRRPVEFCLHHTYGHVVEARIRLGMDAPSASVELLKDRQRAIFNLLSVALNREATAAMKFTLVVRFTGPSAGAWTLEVDHGQVKAGQGEAAKADMTMTMAPYTFEKMAINAINPLWAMITGKIKMKGLLRMGDFGKLTAPLPLEQIVEPVP